ncbi:hypothetical protein [Neisseria elongata]|nr:hypothetical protein [Neisseria elongata]
MENDGRQSVVKPKHRIHAVRLPCQSAAAAIVPHCHQTYFG